jgi:Mlc titration factor MtfA (ptsG expression regulator)
MMSSIALTLTLFLLPLITYLLVVCFQHLRRQRRWSRARNANFSQESRKVLQEEFLPYEHLSQSERSQLELKINHFLLHKRIEGMGELKITPRMKLLIAANACLIITNLDLKDVYPGLSNIFVMESSYIEKDNPVDPRSGRPLHVTRLGESWKRGPIILSWSSIKQSIDLPQHKHNLIIHEFSHHLDQQDGYFDGTPKLSSDQQFHVWANVMGKEFSALRARVARHKKSDIDSYGATNEAEFFAVVTEYFFTDPQGLEKRHQEIFQVFRNYFQIDPRKWTVS